MKQLGKGCQPVKLRLIWQVLSTSLNGSWQTLMRKSALKSHHKQAKVAFERKYLDMDENCNHVVFSDEMKFNLDGPEGFSGYWHDLRQNDPHRLSRNFGGDTVMCWGAFSSSCKTKMCFISRKMNLKMYTDLLKDILIPFIDDNMDGNAIFQKDKASIHVSTLTKSWLTDHNITCLY